MPSRNKEDYLEAIYHLMQERGHARTKDIASALNVKSPSVTDMISKLDKSGLVEYERYGGVKLSKKGKAVARRVNDRHEILRSFLEIIGVSRDTAEQDACVMEHNLHKETIEKIKVFLSGIENKR